MRVDPKLHKRENNGSALILVVVVTMLLSVIGIVFIMTARLRSIASSGVTDSRDLDVAVQSVVSRVDTVLVQDVFGKSMKAGLIDGTDPNNEPYDSPAVDTWLASLEPDATTFKWPYITDLSGGTVTLTWDRVSAIVAAYQDKNAIANGKCADADGDGVADSMWMKLPNLTTSGGKPVYAAVRIIDNCAMLNLNTANRFREASYTIGSTAYKGWFYYEFPTDSPSLYCDSTIIPLYYKDGGRYLSETNYSSFLRGSGSSVDNAFGILAAKKMAYIDSGGALIWHPKASILHQVLMNIESPDNIPTTGTTYNLFDIGDELEMRNRFLLTSLAVARFEGLNCAYNTFDYERGEFTGGWNVPLRVKRTPIDSLADFIIWKERMNPLNFDPLPAGTGPNPGYYDRRHVCTFYSFDRNIRTGKYPLIDAALQSVPAAQRQTVEGFFRPINNRPIDLRVIDITSNTLNARKNILHLLYAFREYFYDKYISSGIPAATALPKAARQSAQIIANMIDYLDDNTTTASGPFGSSTFGNAGIPQKNADPIYINKVIVDAMIAEVSGNNPLVVGNAAYDLGLNATDVVYGYERQPFISEVYTRYVTAGSGAIVFALELVNPYDTQIDLNGWNIKVGTQDNKITAAGSYVVPAGTSSSPGRLVISSSGTGVTYPNFGLGTPMLLPGDVLRLQRPDPANSGQFLTVDKITDDQRILLVTNGSQDTSRKDTNWGFVNNQAYPGSPTTATSTTSSLGAPNIGVGVSFVTQNGYALPVANTTDPTGSGISNCVFPRLGDFQRVAFVSNQPDPNAITTQIATAASEANVRFDMATDPNLLGYICTLNREDEGNLPGRININTAPLYVIAAAIPPQLVMKSTTDISPLTLAGQIVANRPYTSLADLLTKVPAIKKFASDTSAVVGDTSISGDFEKRDWIVSRLSNIFTVRSDTFTAYILVRLGADGPQRRMIAIFDRSNVWSPTDKPKLVALHPVSDPR